MIEKSTFPAMGFDRSVENILERILDFIESESGCNAKTYKLKSRDEIRGAHIAPGENGRKVAGGVFAMIRPTEKSISILRRTKFREGKPEAEWNIQIEAAFSDWRTLESSLKQWSLDPKGPKKPRAEHEFGDGVALPGGLPETNHPKF